MSKLKIAITGACGYIGSQLIKSLSDKYQIIGLYRGTRPSIDDHQVEWRECDLFSISSITKALEDVDIAFYLIHSMLPKTLLFQGNFADTDLILADNFSRACKDQKLKQIIYLGGLIPEDQCPSEHLNSRREVEGVLKSSGIPLTIFRASMVVGPGGSSFEILRNLVKNLPVMLLPKWTKNATQTIFIDDVMRVFDACINNQKYMNRTINLVNGEHLTYQQLLEQTAIGLGLKRFFMAFPFNFIELSKRWVCLFGKADINLVSPLVDSLKMALPHCPPEDLIDELIKERNYLSMLQQVVKRDQTQSVRPPKLKRASTEDKNVRSIQRLPTVLHMDCSEISRLYFYFLPKLFRSLIRVHIEHHLKASFYLFPFSCPMLVLTHVEERSDSDRHLFYISGGFLVKRTDYGWLEFRQIENKKYTLAVIHEYRPKLPWYLYRIVQAPLHHWVMCRFAHFLHTKKDQALIK